MKDREHAVFTQTNNVVNTLNVIYAMRDFTPDAHLVKLGTMGSTAPTSTSRKASSRSAQRARGLPAVPEGAGFDVPPVEGARFPQHPLRLPRLGPAGHRPEPGVVYGIRTDETRLDDRLLTRFDYDDVFGTALNRFCLQA